MELAAQFRSLIVRRQQRIRVGAGRGSMSAWLSHRLPLGFVLGAIPFHILDSDQFSPFEPCVKRHGSWVRGSAGNGEASFLRPKPGPGNASSNPDWPRDQGKGLDHNLRSTPPPSQTPAAPNTRQKRR